MSIASVATPAVVRIEVEVPVTATEGIHGQIPEQFRKFFGIPPEGGQDQVPPGAPHYELGGGTGFIISPDGRILTNAHVVGDAQQITVYLQDNRRYTATLVGADRTTDVAVVKIDAHDLPTLEMGNSDDARVGEWVMAIGNPGLGGSGSTLDYTVTAGIVSAIGRPLGLIGRDLPQDIAGYAIENYLQTDAVINPGNSGGPMVDLDGKVVGINSAIASRSGYYQGYGFAIPINLAHRVMEDLVQYGHVQRPMLGVQITGVTAEDAQYYHLPSIAGVLVQGVTDDSPAGKAGVQAGDVILAVDGQQISGVGDLQQRIAEKRPGQTVQLQVYHGGRPETVQVKLGEAHIQPQETQPTPAAPAAEPVGSSLGMSVEDVDPAMAQRMGLDQAPKGPVITDVSPLGAAARHGLGQGVVILSVNGRAVKTAADVDHALAALHPGDIASLTVELPGGTRRIVNMRVGGG